MDNEKAEKILTSIQESLKQYEDGAIEAIECFNYIAHKVYEVLNEA